jgi:protein-arginine kinase activator protein McsA
MTNIWDERKKGLEEEYFQRKEREALEKMRQRLPTEEHEGDEKASFLRCPKCGETLEQVLFRGILVERCTECQGVWLDSGELERITARESRGWLSHFWRRTNP